MRMEVPRQSRNNQTQQDENQEAKQVRDEVEQTVTQNQLIQNAPQRSNDSRYSLLWRTRIRIWRIPYLAS